MLIILILWLEKPNTEFRMKNLSLLLLSILPSCLFSQRFLEPVFSETIIETDIIYGENAWVDFTAPASDTGRLQPLLLDLYQPADDICEYRPLVIVVHGRRYLPEGVNHDCVSSRKDSAIVEICTRLAEVGKPPPK